MYAGSHELTVGRLDPNTERPAPRHATPVTFPSTKHVQELKPQHWTPNCTPNLFDLRLKWLYPPYMNGEQIVDLDVFRTINVSFAPESKLDDLFSEVDPDLVYLPPESWTTEEPSPEDRKQTGRPESQTTVPDKLSNGRPWPTRGDYWDRAAQLRLSNLDGFRGYARTPVQGQPLPRVTHARPFFEHLDGMVQYWDTSLDQYVPPPAADVAEDTAQPRKRTKLSPELNDATALAGQEQPPTTELPIISPTPVASESTDLTDQIAAVKERLINPRRSSVGAGRTEPSPPPAGTYRGWRVDCGRQMPNGTRDLLVKALIEITLWPFGFNVDTWERQSPRVEVQKLRINVPLTRRVWRPPTDRIEARMGLMYGPVLGMSARPMTGFDEKKIYGDLDLLREYGAMLLLAQERNRMGRTEENPGKGAWWQEKPRWAGMPYEVPGEYPGLSTAPSEEVQETKPPADAAKEKRLLGYTARREKERQKRRDELPSDMTARQKAIHAYKKFTPANPLWEPKAKYMPIGKDPKSSWDEVFLVSALNHHVAILKLRVHEDYLRHVEDGRMPEASNDKDWSSPVLQRTKWYDLLDPAERVEFTRGLWAVAAYLSRSGALSHSNASQQEETPAKS